MFTVLKTNRQERLDTSPCILSDLALCFLCPPTIASEGDTDQTSWSLL